MTECRICGSGSITRVGRVEYYTDYRMPVYDCDSCGCRFTRHHDEVYDVLYSEEDSLYYLDIANRCRMLFEQGDAVALKVALCQNTKFRFIIDSLEHEPRSARILEMGCSRGHLSSYFILQQHDFLGVDISQSAVKFANTAFGEHFAVSGDPRIVARAPYDVIYHTGMIGCVADPLGITREMLSLLRPGGRLLFNAPNRNACVLRDQLWVDAGPPPDLITLFPPHFWRTRFGDSAQVTEGQEYRAPADNLAIALRQMAGQRWKCPSPMEFRESLRARADKKRYLPRVTNLALRIASAVGIAGLAPAQPAEFGLTVSMMKNA